jgi:hypothetical protein
MPALPARGLLLVAVSLVLLIPIWCAGYVPTLDGPIHLNIAAMLARPSLAVASDNLFSIALNPEPNWAIYILLWGLLSVIDNVLLAEKLALSLYALLFLFSFHWADRIIHRRSDFRWSRLLLTVPFVYSAIFYYGFYNFIFSLPLLILAAATYLRFLDAQTLRSGFWAMLAGVGAYFGHATSFGVLGIFVGTAIATVWLARIPLADTATPVRNAARLVRLIWCSILPYLIPVGLFLAFLERNSDSHLDYAQFWTFDQRVKALASMSSMQINGFADMGIALLFGLLLAAATVWTLLHWRGRRIGLEDCFLTAALAMVVVALVLPDTLFGGGYTAIRVQIYVYLLLAAWLSLKQEAVAQPLLASRPALAGLAALCLAVIAVNALEIRSMSRQIGNVVAITHKVKPGSTILPVVFDSWGVEHDGGRTSRGNQFLLNVASLVAFERDAAQLRLYQASTVNFPVRYRAETTPYVYFPYVLDVLSKGGGYTRAELTAIPRQIEYYTGVATGHVDYVLVVGRTPGSADADFQAFRRDLEKRYVAVSRTDARPGAILYARRRGDAPETATAQHAATRAAPDVPLTNR